LLPKLGRHSASRRRSQGLTGILPVRLRREEGGRELIAEVKKGIAIWPRYHLRRISNAISHRSRLQAAGASGTLSAHRPRNISRAGSNTCNSSGKPSGYRSCARLSSSTNCKSMSQHGRGADGDSADRGDSRPTGNFGDYRALVRTPMSMASPWSKCTTSVNWRRALNTGAAIIGINNRDLKKFLGQLGDTTERLAAHVQ